jgi:hypothetical protein
MSLNGCVDFNMKSKRDKHLSILSFFLYQCRLYLDDVVDRYLALVAALASEADWVLVPEWPPEKGWEDVLCNKLAQVSSVIFFYLTVLEIYLQM